MSPVGSGDRAAHWLTVVLLVAIGTPAAAGQMPQAPVSRLSPPTHVDPDVARSLREVTRVPDIDRAVRDRDESCEPEPCDVSSGAVQVAYLQSLPEHTCINVLFNGPERLCLVAFQEEHVRLVLQAAAGLAVTCEGTNADSLVCSTLRGPHQEDGHLSENWPEGVPWAADIPRPDSD